MMIEPYMMAAWAVLIMYSLGVIFLIEGFLPEEGELNFYKVALLWPWISVKLIWHRLTTREGDY
jgi:hypothetical protein